MVHDNDRYARQIQVHGIGPEGQRKLGAAHVVLVGSGADGSAIADRLVRAGVGRLTVIDRDFVELGNLQRQVLYDEQDVLDRLPKAVAAERKLRRINSEITVKGVVGDLNQDNAEHLLQGADLVMDGTDNFDARYLINDVCVKHGMPWVYCGVVSSYGMTMTIIPGKTPCLRCIFPVPPPPGSSVTCDTAGILGPIVFVLGGIAAAEGIKLLVGGGDVNEGIIYIDVWQNTFDVLESGVPRPDCPACGQGLFEYLDAMEHMQVTSLCGRTAVQVRPRRAPPLALSVVADRLRDWVQVVASNEFLFCFRADECEITLFGDGRAIVKGTDDPSRARSLYAKYVGT
jgi:molybdopterin-synthase adenylyltransferase